MIALKLDPLEQSKDGSVTRCRVALPTGGTAVITRVAAGWQLKLYAPAGTLTDRELFGTPDDVLAVLQVEETQRLIALGQRSVTAKRFGTATDVAVSAQSA